MHRKWWSGALVGAAILIGAAMAAQAQEVLKIGGVGPLSGAFGGSGVFGFPSSGIGGDGWGGCFGGSCFGAEGVFRGALPMIRFVSSVKICGTSVKSWEK